MQDLLQSDITTLFGPKDRTELFAELDKLRASKRTKVEKPSLTNTNAQAKALVASMYPPRLERLSNTCYREYYV